MRAEALPVAPLGPFLPASGELCLFSRLDLPGGVRVGLGHPAPPSGMQGLKLDASAGAWPYPGLHLFSILDTPVVA